MFSIFAPAAAFGRRHTCVAAAAIFCFSGTAWAHGAHTHGHGTAKVIVDGAALTVTLDVPLESYLGYDYPPRNEAQQKTWADFRARLAEPLRFVEPPAEAQCSAAQAATVPNLAQMDQQADIVNLVVEIKFDCASPAALKSVGFTAFREYAGLKQLRVQLQNGATRKTLTVRPRFPAVMF
ncbi:MAG: hypothetical protein CVU34_16510 [Betaproteobacteria bacterium HGW-Betaproteobacteria-7]|jgi:hypothetical protein|nr:MAG: hypothetical protein CVU34_16510 [Betaproteobacteria bacterium HGW-Betaproteobacteria-7]